MSEIQRGVRVAQYGLLPPIEGAEYVRDQMRALARYYNDLVALERARRVVYRELRSQYADLVPHEARVARLVGELSELRQAIKDARQAAQRRVLTSELDARARAVHGDLKNARQDLKLARFAARGNVELQNAVREMEARALVWKKGLRATTSVYWGSYLLAEASIDQAQQATVDPDFRRARGRERVAREWHSSAEGRIGVQIQRGMSTAELFEGKDVRLRLVEAPESHRRGRSSVRGLRRCATKLLYVRVGSTGRRKEPVWAVFPFILHRPLPDGAIIKSATITLRVQGMRERWLANFIYVRETAPMAQRPGVVALDLGWRRRPDASLRTAYWVDDQGGHGEFVMPPRIREKLRRASDLRAIQDHHFNRAIRWLKRWLTVAKSIALPQWLSSERPALGQWRSHARLRDLVLRWRLARFDGDSRIFAPLERWMHRSRHLAQYEAGARSSALSARREIYRLLAARFARQYGTVVLGDFDLARAKRLQAPEHGADAPRAQRLQLHESAPGELREALKNAVQREGGLVASLSIVGTTSHCHACGGVCDWDQAEHLSHVCEHCGVTWDQDFNTATNLLRSFARSRPADTVGSIATANRSSRFARPPSPRLVSAPGAE